MSSTVTHEILTPLKCVKQMVGTLSIAPNGRKNNSLKSDQNIINSIQQTCDLVVGQVRASLDYNMADINLF